MFKYIAVEGQRAANRGHRSSSKNRVRRSPKRPQNLY